MSVKVGVRVRPFNKREQGLGARLCVQMQGSTTSITDQNKQTKSFNYDYSFWSHDGFRNDEAGYSHPIDGKYADQQRVYNQIGSSILVNAWEGYNCCLFAYGQTGSGKSYSMIGYGANKGLIPIICNSIFDKIHSNQDGSRSFEVKVSMLQIYNEAVRDLLSKSKKQQLKICQHKTLGVYVQGLQKHGVDSYEKIAKRIEQGSNNRSIAATLMNQSSSRSHTIVSINFVQKIQISMEQTSVKYSMIHLVDLAGSECVAKTGGGSKDRLRETAKINQSLTTLGRVIQILAENCSKKQKDKQFVPYRDSKLTFILRNALGGNSRTAMICAISPADDNYQETLSTLRYASRAKKIQNRAIVNESDVDKLIRLLREENETLKKMLQQARSSKANINYDMISDFNEMNKNMVEMGIVNGGEEESMLRGLQDDSNYNQYQKQSNLLNQSVSISPSSIKINQNLPYLTNISQDQLLSYRIKYSCQKNLMIGSKLGNPKPDIVLTTLGMQPNHAFISFDSEQKKAYIQVLDQSSANYTFVNGLNINNRTKQQIVHLDRIIFGTGCVFLLIFKDSLSRNQQLKLEDIDYQFAINQMQTSNIDKTNSSIETSKKNMIEEEELRKKIVTEIQLQFQNTKREKQEQMKKQIEEKEKEYFQKIQQIQKMKSQENKKLVCELKQRQQQSQRLQNEKVKIQEQVSQYLQQKAAMSSREMQQKKELQQTREMLQLKLQQIRNLQQKMQQLQAISEQKKQEVKVQIKKQQQEMKHQLQLQTIICHNQNIITEYKLQQNKRNKNAKEVKDLLVKKQKIELQKQLVELVPQVERFNLMAKQMTKKVQCGLSIQYKYISEAETIQVIKNNTYKSKMKILVHVINRDEGRSYYWNTDIFKNRFQHALEMFQNFIKEGKVNKINRQFDPYWDPQKYQTVAHSHITLECLMFNISFSGDIAIVSHSKKIGKMKVTLLPTDSKGLIDLSIDDKGEGNQFKITNPHQNIEKTLYFLIEISHIQLIQGELQLDSMKIQYQLLQNYKMIKYSTDIIPKHILSNYRYRKVHIIKEISQTIIMHFMEKPLALDIQVIQRVIASDQLTSRSSFSNVKSSFSYQLEEQEEYNSHNLIQNIQIHQFEEVSPPKKSLKAMTPPHHNVAHSPLRTQTVGVIFENTDITKKVEEQYQKKKRQDHSHYPSNESVNMKKIKEGNGSVASDSGVKKKDKDCQIY